MCRHLPGALLGLGALVAPAAAAPIGFNLISQERGVRLQANETVVQQAAPDFGPFNVTVNAQRTSATQNSSLDGGVLTVDASARARGLFFGGFTADSEFEVTFSLDEPTPYTFVGEGGGPRSALGAAQLQGPGGFVQTGGAANGFASFDFSGVLDPGTYTFIALASVLPADNITDQADIDATLTLVPEPSGGLLLAGLALLGVRRRNC